MKLKPWVCVLSVALLLAMADKETCAIPPLVTGDVPTADKGHVEWFLGIRYQKTGEIERQIPFTELVYGISKRQELTLEIPYLSAKGIRGFGDAVLGTKFQFLLETDKNPGLAVSFELKLANGDQVQGLGTGTLDYDFRLRSQKSFGRSFTGIVNFGYTVVGEPEENSIRYQKRNVLFGAFAQEYKFFSKTKFLSEIYWKNSEKPGEPNRFAADVGFKHHLSPHLAFHAALGKSLRPGNFGEPNLRVYAGVKLEFAVPKLKNRKPNRGG